ncbi:MAG: T9SS type A sorting domain-containing protein [Bacteroidota bacterium]|jgi:hypothetical protein
MRIKYSLTVILLVSTLILKAQFVPIGTSWYYGIKMETPLVEGVYRYECINDTIINNDKYSIVAFSATNPNLNSLTYYLNQDSGRIYFWKYNEKKLLFNTNSEIGDTLDLDIVTTKMESTIFLDTVQRKRVVIDTVYYTSENITTGDSVKVFEFAFSENNNTYNGRYTNTIINKNINPWRQISLLDLRLLPYPISEYNYLRCFTSSNFIYRNGSIPCHFSNVGFNEKKYANYIHVFPNPTMNNVQISLTNNHLKLTSYIIYDNKGNRIRQNMLYKNIDTFEISTEHLANGIYFLLLQFQNGDTIKKKLTIQK